MGDLTTWDFWPVIVDHLCAVDDFRGKDDVARDAAQLARTCRGLRSSSDALFMRLTDGKRRNPDVAVGKYVCPVPFDMRRRLQEGCWVELAVVSKTYLLKPANRQSVRTKVLFDGGRWGTRVWYLPDVRRTALTVYGGRDGWAAERARLKAARDKRMNAAERKEAKRTATLVAALEARGCRLRNDSRLCEAYITLGEGDPEEIAIVMEHMKFYFAHTRYAAIYEDMVEGELEYKGRYHPEEISHCAKGEALREWVKTFPSRAAAASHPGLPSSLRARL